MGRFKSESTGVVVTVADSKDSRFVSGWAPYDGTDPERSETPDDSWTIIDLKAHAKSNEIDLGGATKKADILSAITAAGSTGDESNGQ